ncbi:class A beta-lactamase-related serine hydrolase, partial [bacterium]|nr:class A beta-lactamase-related serine hydrolase [bacterium]
MATAKIRDGMNLIKKHWSYRTIRLAITWAGYFVALFSGLGFIRSELRWVEFSSQPALSPSSQEYPVRLGRFLEAAHRYAGWEGAYGVSGQGNEVILQQIGKSLGPTTPSLVASVSKQFTAAAILRLQAQGKLRIENSACLYLDLFCSPELRKVTIEELLSHTSGLSRIAQTWSASSLLVAGQLLSLPLGNLQERTARNLSGGPLLSPGPSRFNYSNLGYECLSALIEKLTGQSFPDAMKELIFSPFELTQTRVLQPHERETLLLHAEPRLPLWFLGEGKFIQFPLSWLPVEYATAYGAGSIVSSAHDLAKWGEALLKNRVLSPEQTRELFRARAQSYALGWVNQEGRYWHNGRILTYHSELFLEPSSGMTTAILSATRFTRKEDLALLFELEKLLLGKPYREPSGRR